MRILLSSIPSDSHTWNLVFMQLYIEEMGHQVFNLGACVPTDFLVKEAHRYQPDMIVVSSINGHANIEGVEMAQVIRSYDLLRNIPLVIGGKLGTKGTDNEIYVNKLIAAGFDGVFTESEDLDSLANFMKGIRQMRMVATA
jgi:methylaspartate mutase sigma subunit